MAMLKTICSSKYPPKRIDRLLQYGSNGNNDRCLAFGKTKYVLSDDKYGWSKEFIETRLVMGGKSYKDEVFYYHYTISPDPRDHASAEEIRDLALDWVNKVFPGAQAIVSVNNDNEGHIMQAHIIVNAVYPMSGKRVHISKSESKRMWRICQDLCSTYGLSTLPSTYSKKSEH